MSVRGQVNPRSIAGLKVLGTLKQSKDLIRNQTCDLVCSTMPQPTMLPHVPCNICRVYNYVGCFVWCGEFGIFGLIIASKEQKFNEVVDNQQELKPFNNKIQLLQHLLME
jgi:hypothetical protein